MTDTYDAEIKAHFARYGTSTSLTFEAASCTNDPFDAIDQAVLQVRNLEIPAKFEFESVEIHVKKTPPF